MVDWTPAAIEAAHCAMFREPYDGTTAALIGAGLDAAAAAQGIKDEEITRLREENARLIRENKVAFDAVGGVVQANDKLKEENARLREALKPFAEKEYAYEGWADIARAEVWLNVRDIRAAAAAIRERRND